MVSIKDQDNLTKIPGVDPSIAKDLRNIGTNRIDDLTGKNPEELYQLSNKHTVKFKTYVYFMFSVARFIMQIQRKRVGKS